MDPDEPRTGGEHRGLRLAGIPIRIPLSGMLGVLLIAALWSPQFALPRAPAAQQYALAAAFAVLLYLSILAHEAAHALTARAFGFTVTGIVLWVLGGFTMYERTHTTPGREAAVAASGPLTTVVLAVACWFGARAVGDSNLALLVLLEALAWGNGLMAVYNLLPGLPLDGGAVLKSVVWAITRSSARGTIVAAWSGRVLAILMVATPIAIATAVGGDPPWGLIITFAIFAALLWTGATDALRRGLLEQRLPSLSVGALARRAIPVDKDVPLAEALRRLALAGAGGLVVVDHDGRPIALVHEAAVAATPLQRRPWVPVSSVARSVPPEAIVRVDASGEALLEILRDHPAAEYLVVDPAGLVVGVLATADVERALAGGR